MSSSSITTTTCINKFCPSTRTSK
ncbi:unnamed protein product [Coffea canephora]|uniref:Uncharacterized protein n=1 Tax=Coffea canephora TaxID=49390 RepID=A0A068UI29_COFCA|nr:unnamed protein product [Coffea canephora]